MMDRLMDFFLFALPGGFIGSVFTWMVGRRKQNNDMLSQLQASINMLSEENRKILQENVQLRRENAELKASQEETNIKLARLTKEIERLRTVINSKIEHNENIDKRSHSVVPADAADRMRIDKKNGKTNVSDQPIKRRRITQKRIGAKDGNGREDKKDSDPCGVGSGTTGDSVASGGELKKPP